MESPEQSVFELTNTGLYVEDFTVLFNTKSDFYPINSHTPEMTKFQRSVKRDLTVLAHQAMGGQQSGRTI